MSSILPFSDGGSSPRSARPSTKRRSAGVDSQASPFPLPVVPFEAMTLYDDWPDYPMTCGAIFRFRGRIREAEFAAAVRVANRRHPLVESHVAPRIGRSPVWIPSDHPNQPTFLGDLDAEDFERSIPFDMHRDHGVRLWVQQRNDTSTVLAEFHHSCCDGAGGLAYMEDIFAAYASLVRHGMCNEATLPPVDFSLLRNRGKFGLKEPRNVSDFFQGIERGARLAIQLPTPLAVGRPRLSVVPPASPIVGQRFVSRALCRHTYAGLREVSASAGVTLNDFLLGKLLKTIHAWNERMGAENRGTARVLIPVNLRTRSDLAMPMTNRMSYGFISRSLRSLPDDENLLASISKENAWLRRSGMPVRLLSKLAGIQRTGAWPLVFSPKRCLSTAVFSNLGDPTRRFRYRFPREKGNIVVGDLIMTGFEGTTALRPLTRAGLFLNTYGNVLTISARFDPLHYDALDGDRFLDMFESRIAIQRLRVRAA